MEEKNRQISIMRERIFQFFSSSGPVVVVVDPSVEAYDPLVTVGRSVADKAVGLTMGIAVRIPVVGTLVRIVVGPILLVLVQTSDHSQRRFPRC